MIDDFVFKLKYARYNKQEKRRETWNESVQRYIRMLKDKFTDESKELYEIEQAMLNKEILPSMRGLQFGGDAVKEKNMRLYNCTCSYADRPKFFSEALWLLLCGSGVGFSVQRHHVNNLPKIKGTRSKETFIVQDSIEGWSDAVDKLFNAYFFNQSLPIFDYSEIRKEGAPLRHGGHAPGHKPLKQAIDAIQKILDKAVNRQLKTIEVFDCVMHLANCTVTAGTRRSATIAVFDVDDNDMLTAKTAKDWYIEHPQRARANISAVITPNTQEQAFRSIFDKTKKYGEPAFLFLESKEFLVNPCVEIIMCPTLIKDKDKNIIEHYTLDLIDYENRDRWEKHGYTFQSGWQACNLTTVNVSKSYNETDLKESIKLASRLGTYQASYTDTTYLGETSRLIMERESLLGVSLCGMASRPELTTNKKVLSSCAKVAVQENKKTAQRIGIKQASRVTCVKPEGTASLVLGAIGSGIHPIHAKKYIRRVQVSDKEQVFKHYQAINPQSIEKSVWGSDYCVMFALDGEGTVKDDLTALELLERAKLTVEHWVKGGTALQDRLEGSNHNVSLTVTLKPHEWQIVEDYLWMNKESFTGVSLLSATGDHDYPQAPLVAVHEPTENSTEQERGAWDLWHMLKQTTKHVNFENLTEEQDNTKPLEIEACAGGSCEMK